MNLPPTLDRLARDAVLGHLTQGLQRRYTKAAYTNEKREALEAYAK